MPASNPTDIRTAASADATRQSLLQLSRQLAHDLNNIWAHIFGLTQQAREMAGFENRGDVLGRLSEVSSSGLLYSRNVMEALSHTDATPQVFDACEAVREWTTEAEAALQGLVTFSCLVPPYPLPIRFPPGALRMILLSLVGYALRTGDGKRWAMLGVRSAKEEEADAADLMFLCQSGETHASMSQSFQQRIEAIRAVVVSYGGATVTRVVPQVGINVRIQLPLVPVPEDEVADHHEN
ncbi:MAG TPA: hypothetical protein VF471_02150 [Pseudoxanthomonas sp.]